MNTLLAFGIIPQNFWTNFFRSILQSFIFDESFLIREMFRRPKKRKLVRPSQLLRKKNLPGPNFPGHTFEAFVMTHFTHACLAPILPKQIWHFHTPLISVSVSHSDKPLECEPKYGRRSSQKPKLAPNYEGRFFNTNVNTAFITDASVVTVWPRQLAAKTGSGCI